MNLVEAGLIERSLSPYAAPIIAVPHKAPLGSSLTETKRLVIDYHELNKQLPKVQTVQAKSKGSIVFIERAKIDHIWAKLKCARDFSSLDIRSGYHHISIHPESRPKTALFVLMVNLSGKEIIMELHMPQVFSYPQCLSYSLTTWMTL